MPKVGHVEMILPTAWDDGLSAFQNNIRSGIITNVRHFDITTFMTDAATLFELKSDKNMTLEFKNFSQQERVSIVAYTDFECVLTPVENERAYQEHEPFSVGFYVQYAHDTSKSKYYRYRKKTEQEENPANWFVEQLYKLAKELEEMHKNPLPMWMKRHLRRLDYAISAKNLSALRMLK